MLSKNLYTFGINLFIYDTKSGNSYYNYSAYTPMYYPYPSFILSIYSYLLNSTYLNFSINSFINSYSVYIVFFRYILENTSISEKHNILPSVTRLTFILPTLS